MNRRKLFLSTSSVIAFALTVWAIGAAVNLDAINFNATDGGVVSASDFNTAFATVDSNFTALQANLNANRSGGTQTLQNGCKSLTATVGAIQQVDIVPPSDGYALVQASGYVDYLHVTGTQSSIIYGLSTDGAAFAPAQALRSVLDKDLSSGPYQLSLSTHQMFAVTGGATNSFYFAGRQLDGGDPFVCETTLTAVFIPEQFGAIATSPVLAPGSSRTR